MIVAYDAEWQGSLATERHAHWQAKKFLPHSSGAVYVGFPWAALFDALEGGAGDDVSHFEGELAKLETRLPGGVRVVTVCQHLYLEKYLGYLSRLGITDVFWCHARAQGGYLRGSHVRAWPFPLYSALRVEPLPLSERNITISFVAPAFSRSYVARSPARVAEWLNDAPGALVREAPVGEEESQNILARSVFALCFSGEGPNPTRLWECIQSGVVPVVLADRYVPPGDPSLWEQAVVWCRESEDEIRRLPARLKALAADADAMAAKHHALAQLCWCYGVDSFVYDLVAFFTNPSAWCAPDESLSQIGVFYSGRESHLPVFSPREYTACRLYYRSLATALLLRPESVTVHLSGMDKAVVQRGVAGFLATQVGEERALYQRIFARLPLLKGGADD